MASGVASPAAATRSIPWNPLACSDTAMRPNLLLMAKLSWLLLAFGDFGRDLVGPFTPVVGLLHAIPGKGVLLSAGFWLGGFCLLFNRGVRVAAMTVGAVVLLAPFESLPAWHPFAWIAGCVLVLAALQGPAESPRFLRWLLVLVHGATLVGALRGAGWVHTALAQPWTDGDYVGSLVRWLETLLPDGKLARGLELASIVLTAGITLGLMIPPLRRFAAWCALLFHTVIYLALGGREIALFVGAVAIAQIAVLDWPRYVMVVWPRSCGWPLWLRVVLDRYDFERRTDWPRPPDPDAELEAWFDLKPQAGARAITNLVLVFPVFYFVLFALLTASHALLPTWIGVPANALLVFLLLGFSAVASLGSLRHRGRSRPPPGAEPEFAPPMSEPVTAPATGEETAVVVERGPVREPAGRSSSARQAREIIIDIDTPPPADR